MTDPKRIDPAGRVIQRVLRRNPTQVMMAFTVPNDDGETVEACWAGGLTRERSLFMLDVLRKELDISE